MKREFLDGPDIGYALLDGYAGQGYISEACLAVLHYELERNTFKKVYAFTTPDNQKSIKVLERLGMKFIEQIKAGVDTEAKNLYAIYLANTAIPDHHP